MIYNETVAMRVREYLIHMHDVVEKPMFKSLCFMVDGKMLLCVGKDELMCRIDPNEYDAVIKKEGCQPMIHNGKLMKGYIYIKNEYIQKQKDFEYWMNLSLEFNKIAKVYKRKKAKIN